MDWAKAKNLIIFIFLALNIFLAVYLFMSFHNNSSTENIANTEKILKSKGYILNTKIPRVSQEYNLNYEPGNYDRIFIAKKLLNSSQIYLQGIPLNQTLKNSSKTLVFTSLNSFTYMDSAPSKKIDVSTEGKVEKYLIGFMKELQLPISNPYMDLYNVNSDKIIIKFIEKFKGKYIFDNFVEFEISEKGINSLTCNLVKINGFDNIKVNIVPAYQVLLKNFINGNNKVIDKIDLGYQVGADIGVNGMKTPGWRVKFGDGTSAFFDNQGQKK